MEQFKTIDTPTSASAAIKLYRADCSRVLADAKKDARTRRRNPEWTKEFPNSKPWKWHFVGRGVEIIALDEKGERDDDLGGPDYCGAKDLTVKYLRDFVSHAKKCARADGKTLSAVHLAGGFDVYDSFAEYMEDMRNGGCGDYEIWDDWAGQDIPVALLEDLKPAATKCFMCPADAEYKVHGYNVCETCAGEIA